MQRWSSARYRCPPLPRRRFVVVGGGRVQAPKTAQVLVSVLVFSRDGLEDGAEVVLRVFWCRRARV